jgi:hypothetical protein
MRAGFQGRIQGCFGDMKAVLDRVQGKDIHGEEKVDEEITAASGYYCCCGRGEENPDLWSVVKNVDETCKTEILDGERTRMRTTSEDLTIVKY